MNFSFIFTFLVAQWPFLLGGALLISAYWYGQHRAKAAERAKSVQDLLSARDYILIDAAIKRVGDETSNRADYIRLIGYRLEHLVHASAKAMQRATTLGVIGLTASALSSFITGSSFFGAWTVGLSFSVTSVGAICMSISNFLNVETKGLNYLLIAERVRLELTQFVGASSEYATLKPDDAYTLFAETIDKILLEQIAEYTKIKAASAKSAETDQDNAGESSGAIGHS